MSASVLFDAPGPKARTRHLILTVIGAPGSRRALGGHRQDAPGWAARASPLGAVRHGQVGLGRLPARRPVEHDQGRPALGRLRRPLRPAARHGSALGEQVDSLAGWCHRRVLPCRARADHDDLPLLRVLREGRDIAGGLAPPLRGRHCPDPLPRVGHRRARAIRCALLPKGQGEAGLSIGLTPQRSVACPPASPGAHGDAAGAHRPVRRGPQGHRARRSDHLPGTPHVGKTLRSITATPCRPTSSRVALHPPQLRDDQARHVGRASAKAARLSAGKVTNAMPTIVKVAPSGWTGGCRHAGGGGRRGRSSAIESGSAATTPGDHCVRRDDGIPTNLPDTWTKGPDPLDPGPSALPTGLEPEPAVNSGCSANWYGGKVLAVGTAWLKPWQNVGAWLKRRQANNPWLPTRSLP